MRPYIVAAMLTCDVRFAVIVVVDVVVGQNWFLAENHRAIKVQNVIFFLRFYEGIYNIVRCR